MAYVIETAEEKAQKFKESLQPGDYVKILGNIHIWETDDYDIPYGDDLEPINLYATHLYENGWEFVLKNQKDNSMRKSVKGGFVLMWDYKSREFKYFHDNFCGGLEKIDTVDRFQRALRLIGLENEAKNFNPRIKEYNT